ncbi:SWIM-type domain-containing protein [Trichonephila clavata]|uniref:SWIM-type domain-containing protein n=1 Tax=Trichonephila clavata TaxID=2740835 RepID=A0A8X6J2C6_TRICU|nr:SWIM-type domain-containing protein [Trichonephila clavata]
MPQWLNLDEVVFFHKHYSNDISELLNIEQQTIGQNCSVWRNHRKIRLTASDVKQIVSRKSDFPALASNIYLNKNNDLSAIRAVAYGIENENYVRNWFAQKYSQYVVRKTGLVIHPIYQFIAASPDGLIKAGEDFMLLEIKSIFNPKNETLTELRKSRADFCLTDTDGGSEKENFVGTEFGFSCLLLVKG